jgi:hypothetical protein
MPEFRRAKKQVWRPHWCVHLELPVGRRHPSGPSSHTQSRRLAFSTPFAPWTVSTAEGDHSMGQGDQCERFDPLRWNKDFLHHGDPLRRGSRGSLSHTDPLGGLVILFGTARCCRRQRPFPATHAVLLRFDVQILLGPFQRYQGYAVSRSRFLNVLLQHRPIR